jgi:hypothetical protein
MRTAYMMTVLCLALAGQTAASIYPTQPSSGALLSPGPRRIGDLSWTGEAGAAGSVTIVNNAWARVSVEVRKGKNADVNQNPVFRTGTMTRGEKWRIPCSSDEGYVWWRRDADPDHPNGQWSPWTSKACFGHDDEVSL